MPCLAKPEALSRSYGQCPPPVSSVAIFAVTQLNHIHCNLGVVATSMPGLEQNYVGAQQRSNSASTVLSKVHSNNSLRQASLSRATKQSIPTPRGRRPPPIQGGGSGLS